MTDTQTTRDELATDLRATLAARRELGPEMDDELVELMMARVDGYLQHQLTAAPAARRHQTPPAPRAPSGSVSRSGPFRGGIPVLVCVVLAVLLIGPGLGLVAAHAMPVVAVLILLAVFLSRGRRRGRDTRSP